jgi:hypothetical protein
MPTEDAKKKLAAAQAEYERQEKELFILGFELQNPLATPDQTENAWMQYLATKRTAITDTEAVTPKKRTKKTPTKTMIGDLEVAIEAAPEMAMKKLNTIIERIQKSGTTKGFPTLQDRVGAELMNVESMKRIVANYENKMISKDEMISQIDYFMNNLFSRHAGENPEAAIMGYMRDVSRSAASLRSISDGLTDMAAKWKEYCEGVKGEHLAGSQGLIICITGSGKWGTVNGIVFEGLIDTIQPIAPFNFANAGFEINDRGGARFLPKIRIEAKERSNDKEQLKYVRAYKWGQWMQAITAKHPAASGDPRAVFHLGGKESVSQDAWFLKDLFDLWSLAISANMDFKDVWHDQAYKPYAEYIEAVQGFKYPDAVRNDYFKCLWATLTALGDRIYILSFWDGFFGGQNDHLFRVMTNDFQLENDHRVDEFRKSVGRVEFKEGRLAEEEKVISDMDTEEYQQSKEMEDLSAAKEKQEEEDAAWEAMERGMDQ